MGHAKLLETVSIAQAMRQHFSHIFQAGSEPRLQRAEPFVFE
jgi:hypothetical protein